MAQNVTIAGNQYPDVPSILVPKTGGGGNAIFADPSVVTAVAADVASGKYFLDSSGVLTQGTASGGGGATNFVQGTFTTGSTTGTYETLTIPYTGSGYLIALMVYIDGGPYNNETGGNTTWYNSTQRYAVGFYSFVKSVMTTAPTHTSSGTANQGTVAAVYKNSTSVATTYSRTSTMTAPAYVSANESFGSPQSATQIIYFKGNSKTVSYYVAKTSYGLLDSTKYAYIAVYSS